MRLIILLALLPFLGMAQLTSNEKKFEGKWCNCVGFPITQSGESTGKKIEGCYEFKDDHTLVYTKNGNKVYTKKWKAKSKRIWVSVGLTDKMRWYEHHVDPKGAPKLMFFSTYYYVILRR